MKNIHRLKENIGRKNSGMLRFEPGAAEALMLPLCCAVPIFLLKCLKFQLLGFVKNLNILE